LKKWHKNNNQFKLITYDMYSRIVLQMSSSNIAI